jgi:hypothetical protein
MLAPLLVVSGSTTYKAALLSRNIKQMRLTKLADACEGGWIMQDS